MAAAAIVQKKNYKCFKSLEQFYSGGPYSVSPDGSFIACACDETIKIINSSDASVKSTIESDSTSVTALCISPNANFLFSSSHSRQIRVWDLSTLQCLRSWKVSLNWIAFGPENFIHLSRLLIDALLYYIYIINSFGYILSIASVPDFFLMYWNY